MSECLEHLEALVDNLVARIRKLEETTSMANREGGRECGTIALPCPFCIAEDENLHVDSFPHPNTRFPSKFAVRCNVCFAQGPQVTYGNDAISAWNKFVSHHGKVQT